MEIPSFRDIALSKFEKGEVSLEKLERMHRIAEESFAKRPSAEKMEERDGIGYAIKIIRSGQQSA
jgi:hypothetical protein